MWNSTAADEEDESSARGRFEEACEFAEHAVAITKLHLDTRKTEALWLVTSKSIAVALDVDADLLEAKSKDTSEKLTREHFLMTTGRE